MRRSVDRARRGAWMSGRVAERTFQALSVKRRSDEGHVDLWYRLVFQRDMRMRRKMRRRMRWRMRRRMKRSRVG